MSFGPYPSSDSLPLSVAAKFVLFVPVAVPLAHACQAWCMS